MAAVPSTDQPRIQWGPLPGTKQELASLARWAGQRPLRAITQREATPARVLGELGRAGTVHFATHGFFAAAEPGPAHQLADAGARVSAAGRNPLALSGLVLSGANALGADWSPSPASSILTGESIAGLHLPRLELVVLSACETGLGDVAGGEGVLGLQRAFQVAGARNVVASLWKVDDAATQELMALFYGNLWNKKLPPIQALRQAQLTMLTGYQAAAGRLRAGVVEQPFDVRPLPKLKPGEEPLPAFYWAAFVLSGVGR